MKLASEIAISRARRSALLVAPAVMLLSLFFANPLPFTFRWEERRGWRAVGVVTWQCGTRSERWGMLDAVRRLCRGTVGFFFAGDR